MKTENQLAVFAKFWQPGHVKTRLAKGIGEMAASQVYFAFLNHLLKNLQSVGDRRTVVFSPTDRKFEFSQACGDHWLLEAQTEGDLGTKLSQFFNAAFSEPRSEEVGIERQCVVDSQARKVVAIGSDCPLLEPQTIELAFATLDQVPVVLGPSTDGGYYLIGLARPCHELFENIAWSTPEVLDQTIARLNQNLVGYNLLPQMSDIDDDHDYADLIFELNKRCERHDPVALELRERLRAIED